MAAITSSSPGKTILFGEHAVVYGEPAIAIPVNQIKSHVYIVAAPQNSPGDIWLEAPGIGINASLREIPEDEPLVRIIVLVKRHLNCIHLPAMRIKLTSDIPIAAGLGSGASVSISLIRALSSFLGYTLPDEEVNQLAFEIEKIYHGTPSGIDNTVITYNTPILYRHAQPITVLNIHAPIKLLIADTGLKSPTASAVTRVRNLLRSSPDTYRPFIQDIGKITNKAFPLLEGGRVIQLGQLMNDNHTLLQSLQVSCRELDILVEQACNSGAYGAKLCGGGLGGNMIALVSHDAVDEVKQALMKSGAVNVIETNLLPVR